MVSLENLTNNQRFRQVALLYGATLAGVIVGMGVSVLNTRCLDPSAFGDVRFITNYMAFFSGILMFGLFVSASRLMAVAADSRSSAEIKGASVTILAACCILLVAIMLISGMVFQHVLHRPYARLFYCAMPVCMSPLILNYINTTSQGDNSIGMIAAARVLPSVIYLITGLIVYLNVAATSALMLWLQNGIAVLVFVTLIHLNKPSFRNLGVSLKLILVENRRYGLHVYYGSLANVCVPYVAGISLGLFALDNVSVGFYTLALTLASPLAMAPSVIATSYFKQFASEDRISAKVIRTTALISILSVIGFCILIFPVVGILYDSSYQQVALYACFLSLGSAAQGTGDVFNRFLGAHAQGRQLRNGAWISGAISIIGYTAGVWLWGIYGAICTSVLSSMAYLTTMYLYYLKFTSDNRLSQ